MELTKMRPRILAFYQAVEGVIQRKYYPAAHHRPRSAFVYITEGQTRYRFSDGSILVAKEGDILFLARGSLYSMEMERLPYRYIFADFDFADTESSLPQGTIFPMQNAQGTESMFRRMLEKWRLQKPAAEEDCLSILYAIYAEILRAHTAAYLPAAKRARLDKALQFISQNFAAETLTVSDAANAAGMSESHFRRLFKNAYGLSPVRYINLLRVNRAKEYISYTNDSFAEIAPNCGFANVYYFSRIFKKEAGCTPSEFRARQKDFPEM